MIGPAGVVRAPGPGRPRWRHARRLPALALTALALTAPLAADIGNPGDRLPSADRPASPFGPGVVGMPAIAAYRPQSNPQMWAVTQDRQGLMYFGNRDGVLQFDGASWRRIEVANRSTVRSLVTDRDGVIWVGAQGELGFLRPDPSGDPVYVSLRDRLPEEDRQAFADVWKTWALASGIYFQANDRLFRWRPDVARMDVLRPPSTFHFSYAVGERLLVLDREAGLVEVREDDTGALSTSPVPGGAAFAADRVYAVLPLAADPPVLAVVTRDRGIFRLADGVATPMRTAVDDILTSAQPYFGLLLPDDNLAIATAQAGVLVLAPDGGLVLHLDAAAGLPDENVKALYLDRDHHLWMGLNRGAARAEIYAPLAYIGRREGLDGIVGATERFAERLWVATSSGVFRLLPTAGREARMLPVVGLDLAAYDLLGVGDRLFAASNDGVFEILPAADPRQPDRAEVLAGGTALALLAPRRDPDLLLVAQINGLRVLRRAGSRYFDLGVVYAAHQDLRSLFEDADGRLWAGSNHEGVLRFDFTGADDPLAAAVERFGEEAGLPKGRVTVRGIGGRPLFTTEEGLFRLDEETGRFVREPAFGADLADGSHWVTDVAEAPDGTIWLVAGPTHGPGLVRAIGPASAPGLRRLLTANVFSLDVEADGRLWIGTDDWLVRYDARFARPLPPVPKVLVREVKAGGERTIARATGPPPRLAWGENDVRFAVALPSYADVTANEYRFRLEGADERWSHWSTDAVRYYAGLSEGAYRLRVAARDVLGRESPEVTFGFTVLPPWYRTRTAWVGYFVALCALLVGFDRLRARGHAHRERELAGLVAQRTAELGKSEERYRSLVDHASDLILVVDRSGRLHAVNRTCELALGYAREELIGRQLQDFVPARYLGLLFEWLQAVEPYSVGTLEIELRRRDGDTVVVELGITPLPTADGPPLLEAVGRDVTARRELEARLLEAQKLQAVGRLAGGIAEEFRTLLERVRNHAQQAGDATAANLTAFAHLRQVLRDCERGAALTGRLDALAARSRAPRRPLQLAAFLEQHELELRSLVGPKVALEISIEPDLPPALVDPDQVLEVLRQLAENAREAMPHGGTLSFQLSAATTRTPGRPAEEALALRVADTGVGMSEEVLRHVFEPFFTTRGGSEHDGLGLAIVYTLIHQNGGRIEVRSQPGQGTVFDILLPASDFSELAEPVLRGESA